MGASALINNEAEFEGAALFIADGERSEPIALVNLTVAGNRKAKNAYLKN